MSSALYRYFEIRADAAYGRAADAARLKAFLATRGELALTGEAAYGPAPGAPWLSLVLVRADAHGNYAATPHCPDGVNLLAIVCRRDGAAAPPEVFIAIAAWLDWELVEEGDAGGDAPEVVVWRASAG